VVQGFNTLLKGSNLNYRMVGNNTVVIEHKPTAQPAEPKPNSSEVGGDTTLPKVTVEADSAYDPEYYADPYNKDYVLPNATVGTKTDTPIMETPLNVQSISKQVLKDQQVISLDKALRNVSGVTTLSANTPLNGGSPTLRGFATNTLFRNGFRIDGTSFDQQQFANVESVEVLKGPAAILFGRVEPGGLINVVTKQPRSTSYYSLNQQFGSYDLYRTSVDATGPLTKDDTLLYRMNASFQSNNSFRDLVSDENVFFAPILKWNISPRTEATLEMEYQHRNSNQDNQFLPLNNNQIVEIPHSRNLLERNKQVSEQIFVGFNWSHQFNDDWSVKHQVAFKREDSNTNVYAFPGSINLADRTVDRFLVDSHGKNDTVATILDLTGHFNTWGLEHTLLFGGDYYQLSSFGSQANSQGVSIISLDDPIHPGSPAFIDHATRNGSTSTTDNYGLYLQDQIKLPFNVHVMGGLRYQYVHQTNAALDGTPGTPQTDDAVTPRVGLLWQPQKWLSLYSNYAENFGANAGKFAIGNKLLPPESAQQWEVGAKTEFFGGRLRATLAYYDLTKQNVATVDPTRLLGCGGGSCFTAAGEVRSRGPELDIQGEILPGWNVIATYANQDVRITKSNDTAATNNEFLVGQRLQFVPRNVGSVWSTYEVQQGDFKGFKVGGGVNLQDGVVNANNTFKSPGYALLSLLAGYSFEVGKSKVTAQLNVDNLLDKTYFTNVSPDNFNTPPQIAFGSFSTPRTFMGSIKVEY
ncbi:MAG: TonB-dependent siderophore receptor, partial [Methyloglobulus sp.]|nr:TonB-dependent siderophore receptor [Methyloglobulus sp.]